ncbi:hypothetical protein BM613_05455 [Sulfoacidibacillus thermotolerans]|uniref:histidine kinase n=1 Tax=Sulfoacidibacillus thermotolerans TaxID=1765684 RepID=A0A2U3DA00_SULT2|nr:hypothetical protein BM613_05455 [Sulfoacidibacillus thermotolerans]
MIRDGHNLIANLKHREFTQLAIHSQQDIQNSKTVVAVEDPLAREYVVVNASGTILWDTFSKADYPLLDQIPDVIARALNGQVATGTYPKGDPVFEFAAIPFELQTANFVPQMLRAGAPQTITLPGGGEANSDKTKVIVLFARISDLQRITSQIWLAVAKGLIISSLVAAIVGLVMMRRILHPFGQLKAAIKRVENRDFRAEIAVQTGDELEEIATAFDRMVRSLQAFDEGQKRFLQNASHELKTPLMAIRGYAEGLRDGVFAPTETPRILEIVASESVRLKNIVDQLIYLSKLETLEEVYTFSRMDLANLIYQTIERIHPLAKDKGVRLLCDIPEQPALAYVDRDKMVQALINLVSNAIRHSKRQVFIRLIIQECNIILVEDDGDGLAIGESARVFERFFHGAKGDTGLGLSIAKAIVEKHHGKIYAENADEYGARFTIELPR